MDMVSQEESGKNRGESKSIDIETLLSPSSSSPTSSISITSHQSVLETETIETEREVIVYYLALNPPDKPHLYSGENVRLRSSDIGSVHGVIDSNPNK